MKIYFLRQLQNLILTVLVLLSVYPSILLGNNLASKKTNEEYWETTTLKFSDVRYLVNQNKCYTNKKNQLLFLGCIGALKKFALLQKPSLNIIFSKELGSLKKNQKIIKQFGPVYLVSTKNFEDGFENDDDDNDETFTPAQIKRKYSEFKNNWSNSVNMLYEMGSSQFNVDQMFNYLEKISSKKNESYLSGMVLNEYLSIVYDPHTRITPIAQLEDLKKSGDDVFVGIGVQLNKIGKKFILMPMERSPALKAGVKSNDILTMVNGLAVDANIDSENLVNRIRGLAGTMVNVEVLRKGQTLSFSIVRGKIESKNIQSKLVFDRGMKFGIIKFMSFMEEGACAKIEKEIVNLEENGAQGLIFDLRGNGGGLLNEAICIGGLFLGNKIIVGVKDLIKDSMIGHASEVPQLTKLPVITLINASSASASEIVSGALQDYRRSWIVGQKSFGKATVQGGIEENWGPLMKFPDSPQAYNLVLFKTIQRFYQPSGRTNQVVGIVPDFEIPSDPNANENEDLALREGDLYTNALAPIGKPWAQPRPIEVSKIKNCINEKGEAKKSYNAKADEAILPDYQLLVAEDILACSL